MIGFPFRRNSVPSILPDQNIWNHLVNCPPIAWCHSNRFPADLLVHCAQRIPIWNHHADHCNCAICTVPSVFAVAAAHRQQCQPESPDAAHFIARHTLSLSECAAQNRAQGQNDAGRRRAQCRSHCRSHTRRECHTDCECHLSILSSISIPVILDRLSPLQISINR